MSEKLHFNILSFDWPELKPTFYFTLEETENSHPIHKSKWSAKILEAFPELKNSNTEEIFTTFTEKTVDAIGIEIKMYDKELRIYKQYLKHKIRTHFKEKGYIVVKNFIGDVENNKYGPLASILAWHKGKLVFEMYANYGYENSPHFLMSVTKTITSLLLSRAIEMGYLSVADLQNPVLDFFPDIDRTNIKAEAAAVTLYEVLMIIQSNRDISGVKMTNGWRRCRLKF